MYEILHLYNDVNAFASKLIHEVEWNRYYNYCEVFYSTTPSS